MMKTLKKSDLFILILFVYALFFHLWGILQGFHLPAEGFRQSQTAISVWALLHGGAWFAYETPVLGLPWSIPMEFPTYQWIVALCCAAFKTPIDETGRVISILSFYTCFYPVWIILKSLKIETIYRFIFLSLFLVSPLYILFSRDFLIEVFTVLLGFFYLASQVRYFETQKKSVLFYCIFWGSLCAVTKVMTFAGFLSGSLILSFYFNQNEKKLKILTHYFFKFFLIPMTFAVLWQKYSDAVKLKNPAADIIYSKNLMAWTFGSLAQRLDFLNYFGRFLFRSSMTDAVGERAFLIIAAVSFFFERRFLKPFLLLIGCYFITTYTFISLYLVNAHGYYRTAVGFYIVFAFAYWIYGWIIQTGLKHKIGLIFLALLTLGASYRFTDEHLTKQLHTDDKLTAFSKKIDEVSDPNGVLYITGFDWNPSIAYQARRRAHTRISLDTLKNKDASYDHYLKLKNTYPTAGLVVCANEGPFGLKKYEPLLRSLEVHEDFEFAIDDSVLELKQYNCFFFKTHS